MNRDEIRQACPEAGSLNLSSFNSVRVLKGPGAIRGDIRWWNNGRPPFPQPGDGSATQ
ncbi:hypothetical protein OG806_16850 [Streptomyces sp. NBC_00882]|uniref:hypothetical protein n=1 Tax=Streptomyces TaxID=1883 RepID=UPI00386576D5|nr:hypothetical protein OG806_16850 [Streptomyces sp. NBC_00882]WSZ57849.1 hypothetical protein OH824_15380 [Streptomyces canus]